MSAIGKITLDIKDYVRALEQVKRDTKAAGRQMSRGFGSAGNAVDDIGKKVGKAGSAVSAFASEVGSSFGAAGRIISAVASGPVMALTVAIGGLVALGVQVWDKMTLSAEEYAAKLDRAAAAADKHREAVEKQTSEDQTYMDRLAELASKEELSNEAKSEAATLIANLTSRYGDLGLSIDKVTGKISGMDKAQAAFAERVRKERMQAISEQLGSTERRAANEAKNAVTGMYVFGNRFGGAAEGIKQTREVMTQATIPERIAYAESLRDASKTTKDAEAWQKVIDSLEKVRNLQREYNLLSETGRATEKEAAEAMKKRSEAAQKQVEAEAAARAKIKEATESTVTGLETELKIQTLINQGLTEEAAKLKAVEALRKQGITDAAAVEKITGLQGQLRGAKFAETQREQSLSLYDRALRASGRGEQADIISAVQAAEKAKGGKLTGEEYDRVLNMAELARSLEKAAAGQNFGDLAVRTNSLTARGGFATGAVAPDMDKYQRAIAENGKQMLSIVGRIEKLCEDFGTF